MRDKELMRVEVHCDYSDLKKLQNCDAWIVEAAEFNTDSQRCEIMLRQMTLNDI